MPCHLPGRGCRKAAGWLAGGSSPPLRSLRALAVGALDGPHGRWPGRKAQGRLSPIVLHLAAAAPPQPPYVEAARMPEPRGGSQRWPLQHWLLRMPKHLMHPPGNPTINPPSSIPHSSHETAAGQPPHREKSLTTRAVGSAPTPMAMAATHSIQVWRSTLKMPPRKNMMITWHTQMKSLQGRGTHAGEGRGAGGGGGAGGVEGPARSQGNVGPQQGPSVVRHVGAWGREMAHGRQSRAQAGRPTCRRDQAEGNCSQGRAPDGKEDGRGKDALKHVELVADFAGCSSRARQQSATGKHWFPLCAEMQSILLQQ